MIRILLVLLLTACNHEGTVRDTGVASPPWGAMDYCVRNPDKEVCQ